MKHWIVAAALTALAVPGLAQQKRVYIANDDHTDYYWTADGATYRTAFLAMLDYYLAQIDATAANPSDFQSRFACDGSFWLWEYEHHKTPAEFARLVARLRDGHVSAPRTALVSCYGGQPIEAVLRGMYYSGALERRHGIRFDLAVAMENQSLPWGLASLWAGAGAKYSWRGICGCGSQIPNAWNREHDVYDWVGPDGQSILMKWNTMWNGNQSIGGYAEARDTFGIVDYVTQNAQFQSRWPYTVIGAFGRGWDDLSTFTNDFVLSAQQKSNAQRRVIVSNEQDFFDDFRATYPSGLPVVDCSFGNEWELYCASLAEVSAGVKRSLEKLRAAEALAALDATFDPSFAASLATARDQAWIDLGLYWEHDWTMDGPASGGRIAWQRQLDAEIRSYVDALHAAALARFGTHVTSGGSNPRVFAFNPLGWKRTDVADFAYSGATPVHVVEVASGNEVPSELVTLDGVATLRFLASNVPAIGYETYELVPGAGATFSDAATVTAGGGGGTPVTRTYSIASDDRDALSLDVGGAFQVRVSGYSSAEKMDFVSSDSEAETGALEFALDVPAGATILSANLILRAAPSQSPSSTGAMRVRAYDVDDATPFVDGAPIDLVAKHPLAAQSALWSAPTWTAGQDQTSPDLAALVQAFVNRSAYAVGKHLGLVIDEGTLPANHYYGWEDFASGGTPARLSVTYTTGGGGASGWTLENTLVKLVVAERGAITSLVDKTAGNVELAALVGGRALNDLGAGSGTVTVEHVGPVSVTIVATGSTPLAHTTRITLFRDSNRVDLDDRITQNFGAVTTWGFGFNLTSPRTRHEEVGAIGLVERRSNGGYLADTNARCDWATLNHFADVTGANGRGLTLSNRDAYFFKVGNSTAGVLDTATPSWSVLAGGQVDGSALGAQNQGGDSSFRWRFALRPHGAYDQPAALRFALEHQDPLVCGTVTGSAPRLPAASFTGFSCTEPDVLLWAFKPADDGASLGPVARLWNASDSARTATIRIHPYPVLMARTVTHVETDLGPVLQCKNSLTLDFTRQELRSVRLLAPKPIEAR